MTKEKVDKKILEKRNQFKEIIKENYKQKNSKENKKIVFILTLFLLGISIFIWGIVSLSWLRTIGGLVFIFLILNSS